MPSLRGSRWGDNEPDGKDRYHRRIPILPTLDEILQAGPCADLAFICGENGRPLTKESFGNVFRDACNAAGVTKSAHGVRKIGATRAANNGATVAELEAIFGWNGGRMLRSTPAQPIGHASQRAQWRSWTERPVNKLFPHLLKRCGSQNEKTNDFSALFLRRCDGADGGTRTRTLEN